MSAPRSRRISASERREEVAAAEADRAGLHAPGLGQEPHDGPADRRLPGSGLPDQPEDLARAEREIDRPRRQPRAVADREARRSRGRARGHRDALAHAVVRSRGSRRSREPFPEQVEADHRDDQGQHRNAHAPPAHHEVAAPLGDHGAPRRRGRLDPEPHEREQRLDADGDGHLEGDQHDDQGHEVGQELLGHHAERPEPDGAGRLDELALAERQDLAADHAGEARPVDDHDGQDHLPEPEARGRPSARSPGGRRGSTSRRPPRASAPCRPARGRSRRRAPPGPRPAPR